MTYDQGDAPVITVEFKDEKGILADPTTVEFSIKKPDGTVDTTTSPDASITKDYVGLWKLQLPILDQPGRWYVRAAGTDGLLAAAESGFAVRTSEFA